MFMYRSCSCAANFCYLGESEIFLQKSVNNVSRFSTKMHNWFEQKSFGFCSTRRSCNFLSDIVKFSKIFKGIMEKMWFVDIHR